MTDVPDLVRVTIVAPIGNSDHSSLSAGACGVAKAIYKLLCFFPLGPVLLVLILIKIIILIIIINNTATMIQIFR